MWHRVRLSSPSVRPRALVAPGRRAWTASAAGGAPWRSAAALPACRAMPATAAVAVTAASPRRTMATAAQPSRAEIVQTIKGQTLRLPDLEALFEGWPRLTNPHQERVTEVVKQVLEQYTVSPTVLAKLTKGNLDALLATWYPYASPERLTELAYFVCWMFILDDEVDTITAAGRDSDAAFGRIWAETLRVISEGCALHGEGDGPFAPSEFMSVESFRGIGRWLKERYSFEQRMRFWTEIERTANSYRTEQRIRRQSGVPQYDTYCEYRYGSCCMAQVVSMIEYANESRLPEDVMTSPEMQALWAATTKLLWINNDIVSIKKEVADDFLENLVVIASTPGYRLQDGLDHCVQRLRDATVDLDRAATTLERKYVAGRDPDSDVVARDVARFITNCRSMSIGTMVWSRASPRYGLLHEERDADGCVSFTVGEAPL